MKDFGNSSFRIALPAHLKQRGIHDVFHASLLRIHHPNDDRLFPGRLDSQIGLEDISTGEWAVDKILSHFGSGEDAIFEIKWKAGDVTWLPYYQVANIQALAAYLELLGVDNIKDLPKGKGSPPHEDPQIFLGQISSGNSESSIYKTPSPFLSSLHRILPCFPVDPLKSITQSLCHFRISFSTMARRSKHSSSTSTSSNRSLTSAPNSSAPSTINHPNFSRVSATLFLVRDTTVDPPQLYRLSAAELYACATHDNNCRDQPRSAATQPSSPAYPIVTRAYNHGATTSARFAIFDPTTATFTFDGDRIDPAAFNINLQQRGAPVVSGPALPDEELAVAINAYREDARRFRSMHRHRQDQSLKAEQNAIRAVAGHMMNSAKRATATITDQYRTMSVEPTMIPSSSPTPTPQAISTHHQPFPVPKMDLPPPQPVASTSKEALDKIGRIPKVPRSNHIDEPAPGASERPATPLSDVHTSHDPNAPAFGELVPMDQDAIGDPDDGHYSV